MRTFAKRTTLTPLGFKGHQLLQPMHSFELFLVSTGDLWRFRNLAAATSFGPCVGRRVELRCASGTHDSAFPACCSRSFDVRHHFLTHDLVVPVAVVC